jgi:two-component system, sporulation sensor kinase D
VGEWKPRWTGWVSVIKSRQKNWCEIKVSDTGTGIDENALANIFDPCFTTKSSGTGLAIVHNRIEVETIQEQGTTVSLFLPLIKKGAGMSKKMSEA